MTVARWKVELSHGLGKEEVEHWKRPWRGGEVGREREKQGTAGMHGRRAAGGGEQGSGTLAGGRRRWSAGRRRAHGRERAARVELEGAEQEMERGEVGGAGGRPVETGAGGWRGEEDEAADGSWAGQDGPRQRRSRAPTGRCAAGAAGTGARGGEDRRRLKAEELGDREGDGGWPARGSSS